MPFELIDNEVFFCHRGVAIYRLHKDDFADSRRMDYNFGTQPSSMASQGISVFDVREFDPQADPGNMEEVLRKMIDELFEKGTESFLFPYLETGRVPVPDDRPAPEGIFKTTITVWSRSQDEGLRAAEMIQDGLPGTVVFRSACEAPRYPDTDKDWDERCDEVFRKTA